MVTAKSTVTETIHGLDSGADDYLSKPFEWNVLLARLRSLLRRSEYALGAHIVKSFPGLELDLDAARLTLDGRAVPLTPKEFDLLRVFLSRPDVIHSHSFLWESAWGFESDGWERTLIVTISALRKKLGARWGDRLRTHTGRGYSFEPGA